MNNTTQKYLLNIVKSNYETIAQDFSATRQRLRWPDLEPFVEMVSANQTVLDVGCGDGRLLTILKNRFAEYVGVESSLELAKITSDKINVKSGRVLIGDLLNLNKIVTEKFDWVFCIAVLHHIPSSRLQIKALEQLKERLNDNGRVVLSVWRMWNWPKLRSEIIRQAIRKALGQSKMDFGDIIFEWKRGERSLRYYHFFTERGLRQLIKKSGLIVEQWERGDKNHYIVLKSK